MDIQTHVFQSSILNNFIFKHLSACTCDLCMTYLTYLTATHHICINARSWYSYNLNPNKLKRDKKKQNKTQQKNRCSKIWKTRLNKGQTYKRKQRKKHKWIRVFGHKCACASQLYAYEYFEYAYACMKHAQAYTSRTFTQQLKIEKQSKTINLTTYHIYNTNSK